MQGSCGGWLCDLLKIGASDIQPEGALPTLGHAIGTGFPVRRFPMAPWNNWGAATLEMRVDYFGAANRREDEAHYAATLARAEATGWGVSRNIMR